MGAGNKVATELFISHHPLEVSKLLDLYYIGDVQDYKPNFVYKSKFYETLKTRVDGYLQNNSVTLKLVLNLFSVEKKRLISHVHQSTFFIFHMDFFLLCHN